MSPSPTMPVDELLIALSKPVAPELGKPETIRRIAAATGDSPASILLDLIRLAQGPGRIQLSDYVRLRLFDRAFWQDRDRSGIVGEKQNRLIADLLNDDRQWVAVLSNKVAASAYLAAYGLPVIPTLAIWQRGATTSRPNILTDVPALIAFLSGPENYPLFGKPVDGLQSIGAIALDRCVTASGQAITSTGVAISVQRLAAEIALNFDAFLFQPRLLPHGDIAQLSVGQLATVRLLTLNMGDGAQVLRACMKLNGTGNVADNYWRRGNLLAQIDPASGRLSQVTTGLGFELEILRNHPDTNAPICGARIPFWSDIIALGFAGSELMRHVPLIGWDIGISDAGGVIVEMNETPDFLLPQIADRAGILDHMLIEALHYRRAFGDVVSKRRMARLRVS